ncbi:MAG: hypothetical protein JO335_08770 [Sphingomonas sp.]|nr:hypothetical protein [Sphingomonas sp.]
MKKTFVKLGLVSTAFLGLGAASPAVGAGNGNWICPYSWVGNHWMLMPCWIDYRNWTHGS